MRTSLPHALCLYISFVFVHLDVYMHIGSQLYWISTNKTNWLPPFRHLDGPEWQRQSDCLRRLPETLQPNGPECMLRHVGVTIKGVNSPQIFIKTTGGRTTAHREGCGLSTININVGPCPVTWFAVDQKWVRVRANERERERESVCVCVCVWTICSLIRRVPTSFTYLIYILSVRLSPTQIFRYTNELRRVCTEHQVDFEEGCWWPRLEDLQEANVCSSI